MDRNLGRVQPPEEIWLREDQYGIDLDGAYGVKPDGDSVRYMRADLAPPPKPGDCYIAIPDGASLAGLLAHDTPEEAEKDVQVWADAGIAGSVRHFREVAPSGPSQDSQEVDERAAFEAWLRNGPYEPSPTMALWKGWQARAALSQSPKGAAGARECWVRWKTKVPYPSIFEAIPDKPHHMSGPGWEWVRMVEAAGGESGPSAPKTGLREPSALSEEAAAHLAYRVGELSDALQQLVEDIETDGGIETEDWPEFERAKQVLEKKAPKAPLSEAKGPDLPPSSQPAPGDVGEAGRA